MLTLSRRKGEALVLQVDDIEICVVFNGTSKRSGASFSIDAPDDVLVLREELLEEDG